MKRRMYVPEGTARIVTGTRNGAQENTALGATHPRRSFSLSDHVKSRLTPAERVRLCEQLAPYWTEAHKRWPGEEIEATIDGVTYRLCAHVTKAGKVRVGY